MAAGKFTNPRNPNSEELEIEEAFRQVMGEAAPSVAGSVPSDPAIHYSDEDLLVDITLDELLQENDLTDAAPTTFFPPLRDIPENSAMPDEAPEPVTATPVIRRNRKIMLVSLISLFVVVVIGLALTVGYFFGGGITDNGLILQNVTVAGVNLGGMTREQAVETLHAATDLTYTNLDMVVVLPDTTITLTPMQTGAALDVNAAVEAAYDYGRTGSLSERRAAKATVQAGEYHIGLLPYLILNTDYIRQELDAYGASFNSTYSDSSWKLEGDMPALEGEKFDIEAPCQTLLLNAGSPGRHLDINAVYNQVLDAYSFNVFKVDASQAAPEENPEPLDLELLLEELMHEPVAATFDTETFDIIPEVYGYGFDLELAAQLLAEAEPGTVVSVPMEYIVPEETRETLEALLFRDMLSYVETPHTTNENRNNNLRLACAAIDGLVLMPGEIFDYNEALGERTPEAGYKPAGAYVGGKTVLEYGGGICQVSSTLYYATLLADMEIVKRYAHGYISSYIDPGMDATVSWGGPDFQFANNTNYPIRIEAEVSEDHVKVWLYGTDEKDYYVKMEYKITSSTPYETVYEEYPEDNAEGYKDGDIIQTAYTGFTVNTYRCKYSKETDELISRDLEARSVYNARDLIIAKIVTEETTDPSEDPTEPSTGDPTEPPSEDPTEPPTEAPTEAPTETPTETTPPTEAPTAPPTETPTDGGE